MKSVSVKVDVNGIDYDGFSFFFLGDIHEGNANHAEEEFKNAIDIIANTPNSYVVLMGDHIDAINHRDPRFDPIEIANKYGLRDLKNLPVKQTEHVANNLMPIKDKIIAMIYGNHEESYVKHNSFDPIRYLNKTLGGDIPILGYTGFINFSVYDVEKSLYRIVFYVNHGYGGGGFREGYPLNKIHDISRWKKADVFVMGHIHQMHVDRKVVAAVDKNGKFVKREQYYGTNGCFLYKEKDDTRGYFEGKPGPASDIGMLKLNTNRATKKNNLKMSWEKIFLG